MRGLSIVFALRRQFRWAVTGVLCGALAGLLGAAEPVAPVPTAGNIRFSGILGQSEQSPPRNRLPFCGASGVVIDQAGQLWTGFGEGVYCFRRSSAEDGEPARWRLEGMVPVPGGVRTVLFDGRAVFAVTQGYDIWQLPQDAGDAAQRLTKLAVPGGARVHALAVSPDQTASGWARPAKYYALGDQTVFGCKADGSVALTHRLPTLKEGRYQCMAILPESGDMMVGSGYPDQKLYRFTGDGAAAKSGGWPRGQQADVVVWAGRELYACGGGHVVRLAQSLQGVKSQFRFPLEWTYYTSGLARAPDGTFWVSSSQGIIGFSAQGAPLAERIGGLPQVERLAAAADGTLIAINENGQRFLRLGIDDAPDMPLRCAGNEPWRTGGGWQGRAVDVACAGDCFAVPDKTAGCVWRFDPWRTAWAEKPWISWTANKTFPAPRAIAASEGRAWILDGGRFLETAWGGFTEYMEVAPAKLPGLNPLQWSRMAGIDDRTLAVVQEQALLLLRRGEDGAYGVLWKTALPAGELRAFAANDRWVACGFSTGAEAVRIYRVTTGAVHASLAEQGDEETGSFTVSALTLLRDWLVVADAPGHRLLRFRIVVAD